MNNRLEITLAMLLFSPIAAADGVEVEQSELLQSPYYQTIIEQSAHYERQIDRIRGDWTSARRVAEPLAYLTELEKQLQQRQQQLKSYRRVLNGAVERNERLLEMLPEGSHQRKKLEAGMQQMEQKLNEISLAYGKVETMLSQIPAKVAAYQAKQDLLELQQVLGNSELVLAETESVVEEPFVLRTVDELLRDQD